MNILIKLTCLVGLVIAPLLATENDEVLVDSNPINIEVDVARPNSDLVRTEKSGIADEYILNAKP